MSPTARAVYKSLIQLPEDERASVVVAAMGQMLIANRLPLVFTSQPVGDTEATAVPVVVMAGVGMGAKVLRWADKLIAERASYSVRGESDLGLLMRIAAHKQADLAAASATPAPAADLAHDYTDSQLPKEED